MTVGWGLLGTGNICAKFAKGLHDLGNRVRIAAVASRDRAKAMAFAAACARPGDRCAAYGSYAELLADPAVTLVYVGLPNHLHAEWAIAAARAGKHVLCEKPSCMTAAELEGVLAEVRRAGTFFMEGFLYRCHPRHAWLRRRLAEGAIGRLRMAHAVFCFDITGPAFAGQERAKPEGRVFNRAMGGGALMDVGCYPVSWLRWMASAEPEAVAAAAELGPGGCDHRATGSLLFPDGFVGSFATAVTCAQPSVAQLHGELGRVEIEEPWRCPDGARIVIRRHDGGVEEHAAAADGLSVYAREALVAMEHCVHAEAPPMTWADSLGQARTLDRLRHAMGLRWPGEPAS